MVLLEKELPRLRLYLTYKELKRSIVNISVDPNRFSLYLTYKELKLQYDALATIFEEVCILPIRN